MTRRGRGVTTPGPGRRSLVVFLALLVGLVLGGCSGTRTSVPTGGSTGVPTSGSAGVPMRGSTSGSTGQALAPLRTPTVDLDAQRRQTVADLVARRAAALVAKNRRAWLATVSDPASAFASRQAAVFDRMSQLPLAGYGQTGMDVGLPMSAARQRVLGPDAWVVQLRLTYSLRGYDRAPRTFSASYTLARTATGWGFADDVDGGTQPQPWDISPMTVLASPTTLVIGSAPRDRLENYLALGDAAHAVIAGVWGSAEPGVIIAPATSAELVAALQRPDAAGLDQVAAITNGPIDAQGSATSDRVYINPDAFARLNAQGRRVVVTHELTHVTVRATTTRVVPLWLSEGFADYVGFSGLGLDPRSVAADLLTQVRAGTGPTALPPDADFDPAKGVIAPVYNSAWLAISRISSTYGQGRLVLFYRAVAGAMTVGAGVGADAVAQLAFPAVLGVTQDAFTARWLTELRRLAR